MPRNLEPAAETVSPLNADFGWLLGQAKHVYATEVTAALEEIGISPRGYHVLSTAMCGEQTQTELAQLIGLDKTTMVVTVDELERAGLAERRPSETDRRARVIAVTPAGKRPWRRARRSSHASRRRSSRSLEGRARGAA